MLKRMKTKIPTFLLAKQVEMVTAFLPLHRGSLSVMSHFVIFFAC
jgi:hypothetical protein